MNSKSGFVCGLVVALFVWVVGLYVPGSWHRLGYQAQAVINECEFTLPRNQTCELTAVPKGEE